jgi:hypothetical protein
MVQPMQEPRGTAADTAISVVQHEEATVGHRGRHGISARCLRSAFLVMSRVRM